MNPASSETPTFRPVLACEPRRRFFPCVSKYATEPPIAETDRQTARARAKARKATLYALTIVCHDEADQQELFKQAARSFAGRRIRVVVS